MFMNILGPEQQKMCVITRGHFKTPIQGAEKSFQRKSID